MLKPGIPQGGVKAGYTSGCGETGIPQGVREAGIPQGVREAGIPWWVGRREAGIPQWVGGREATCTTLPGTMVGIHLLVYTLLYHPGYTAHTHPAVIIPAGQTHAAGGESPGLKSEETPGYEAQSSLPAPKGVRVVMPSARRSFRLPEDKC